MGRINQGTTDSDEVEHDETQGGTSGNPHTDSIGAADVGAADGVAGLNSSGEIPNNQIPPLAINDTYSVATESDLTTLSSAEIGDVGIVTDPDPDVTYMLTGDYSVQSDWEQIAIENAPVSSVNGNKGDVSLDAADVNALPDTYTAPVQSVNSQIGDVTVDKTQRNFTKAGSLSFRGESSQTFTLSDTYEAVKLAFSLDSVSTTNGSAVAFRFNGDTNSNYLEVDFDGTNTSTTEIHWARTRYVAASEIILPGNWVDRLSVDLPVTPKNHNAIAGGWDGGTQLDSIELFDINGTAGGLYFDVDFLVV